MTPEEKLLQYWTFTPKNQNPPKQDIKVYTLKPWRKYLPPFMRTWFAKPTIYKDCQVKSIGEAKIENDAFVIPVTMTYATAIEHIDIEFTVPGELNE
jgi:hypothetical protein